MDASESGMCPPRSIEVVAAVAGSILHQAGTAAGRRPGRAEAGIEGFARSAVDEDRVDELAGRPVEPADALARRRTRTRSPPARTMKSGLGTALITVAVVSPRSMTSGRVSVGAGVGPRRRGDRGRGRHLGRRRRRRRGCDGSARLRRPPGRSSRRRSGVLPSRGTRSVGRASWRAVCRLGLPGAIGGRA